MILDAAQLADLMVEYGEAFYLLDSAQFRKNFCELRDAFSAVYPHFQIAYSYKTNYTPKLCRIVDDLGGYAEVVSDMERELAYRCGVRPERIIWNGPVKDEDSVRAFLLQGGTVHIDTYDEARFLQKIAGEADQPLRVGIRCNYDVRDGVCSRFGLDIDGDDFKRVLEIVQNTPNLHFTTLHCHFAKRQLKYWPARVQGMVSLLHRIGVMPERLDIGGGLFGKMPDSLKDQFSDPIPSYAEYAAMAATFADAFANEPCKPELVIEPGSALIGDCMRFVGTVKSIKTVRGKVYATVLGSQKNISMTGVNPPLEVISMGAPQQSYTDVDLVGFTCIEGDVLYKGYCGPLAKGDAVVLGNCGSYSLVMKPPFILPNFPVLDVSEGKVELIKRGETFDDIFHTFLF